MKKIHLSKSYSNFSLEDVHIKENNVFQFEEVLESYLGNKKHVAALNSGTSALHLALIQSGVTSGDIIICQSFTFSASVNPIIYQGATPVFIDSDKETWNMCPILLELAITDSISKGRKPKAIIFVHLYGMPAKIDEISKIAQKYKIILIEDAAEALGSEYNGRKCGTFGDFGILSFNNNKIITTFGGGALVCNSKEEKNKAIFLATQAREAVEYYQHLEIGYNYRMSTILAGIGSHQIKDLYSHITLRREKNDFYSRLFKDIKGVTVFKEHSNILFSNHWLTCIIIDAKKAGFTRDELLLHLKKEHIESRPLWKPMHVQPVFEKYKFFGGDVSLNLFDNGLCLPSGSDLTVNDLNRIQKTINNFL